VFCGWSRVGPEANMTCCPFSCLEKRAINVNWLAKDVVSVFQRTDPFFLSLLDSNDGILSLSRQIFCSFFTSKMLLYDPKIWKRRKILVVPNSKTLQSDSFLPYSTCQKPKEVHNNKRDKKKNSPRSRHVIGSRRISHGTRHCRKGFRSKTSREKLFLK
jgi:hypothetical protein